MDSDDGQECGVVIPLSLINAIHKAMIEAIDKWHEDREIDDVDLHLCVVAMMAAVDAAADQAVTHVHQKHTIQ